IRSLLQGIERPAGPPVAFNLPQFDHGTGDAQDKGGDRIGRAPALSARILDQVRRKNDRCKHPKRSGAWFVTQASLCYSAWWRPRGKAHMETDYDHCLDRAFN